MSTKIYCIKMFQQQIIATNFTVRLLDAAEEFMFVRVYVCVHVGLKSWD